MDKKLLKSREDFIKWKNYYGNDDYYEIGLAPEEEEEPKEYPCVVFYSAFLFTLHYHFAYQSDFKA